MMGKNDIKGMKELQKTFSDLEKKINNLNDNVAFDVLFSNSFMSKYTNFSSFDEFLEAGGFNVETQEDFEAIPDDDFDKHVSESTKFSSWEEMLQEAGTLHVKKQLGL